MLPVAEPVKDAENRLGHVQDLARGQEVVEERAGAAEIGRAPADRHAEAAARDSIHLACRRAPPDVVDRCQRVVLAASLPGDLELSRQRCAQRMPEQVTRQRFGVRHRIEDFVGRHAAVGTGGDVADRIAAGLAGRESRVPEPPHRGLDVVELHEVELEILARGDVTETA